MGVEGYLPHAGELPGGAGLLLALVGDGKVQGVGPHGGGLGHHRDTAVPDKPVVNHHLQLCCSNNNTFVLKYNIG